MSFLIWSVVRALPGQLPHTHFNQRARSKQTFAPPPTPRTPVEMMTHTPEPDQPSRQTLRTSQRAERKLERRLSVELAPLDRRALGLAAGITSSLAVLLLTIVSLLVDSEGRFPLNLLANYFRGYSVSWSGAGVGAVGDVGAPPEGELPPHAKALAESAIVTNKETRFRVQ